MRILVRIAGQRPRRWVATLLARLAEDGHAIGLDAMPASGGTAAGTRLFSALERAIYGASGPTPLDLVAAPWPGAAGPADLVLDLAGDAPANAAALTIAPLYDGAPGEAAALAALLGHRAPRLTLALRAPGDADWRVAATALPALEEAHHLARSLWRVLARMAELIRIGVHDAAAGIVAAGPAIAPGAPVSGPSMVQAARFVGGGVAGKLGDRLRRRSAIQNHWRLGWRFTRGDGIADRLAWPSAPYSFLPDDGQRFFADPFVLWKEGAAYLFCEEFPYATGKGVISVVEIGADGRAGMPRVVLERPYHLSYPMVFERGGVVFMIPETSANRTIELYRANRFPEEWTLERVLLNDVSAADATLLEHGGKLWLFASLSEDGGSSWDRLGLFSAPDLLGPWTAHPRNPVLIDASCARPAGLPFRHGGALIRPAQDCTLGYGSALTLCRVDRLDEVGYAQTVVARLPAPADWQAEGTHTLNAAGGLEVVDCVGWRKRGG